jgi:hypothetical protein
MLGIQLVVAAPNVFSIVIVLPATADIAAGEQPQRPAGRTIQLLRRRDDRGHYLPEASQTDDTNRRKGRCSVHWGTGRLRSNDAADLSVTRTYDWRHKHRLGVASRTTAQQKASWAIMFGSFEEIFLPSAARSREELEKQKLVGEAAPAPTEPPRLDPPGLATDEPGRRFTGKVVIRR